MSKSIKEAVKDKLVSSPDHGTTYMKPKSLEIKQRNASFPSLDAIAAVRKNHLFKHWVKPIKSIEKRNLTKTKPINWFYSRNEANSNFTA